MQNAKVKFLLELLKPPVTNTVVVVEMELSELEENDISGKLIDEGHYTSIGWPYDYYKVLSREIHVFND